MGDGVPARLPPGIYPFWFWNDRLREDEVRRQVRAMAEQGVRGFYIHPRQGLQQPYLGEAFFRLVEAAADEAQRQGLWVHLYDEYPYPSGVAGGEVILGRPRLWATRLIQRRYEVAGGAVRLELPPGRVLAAVAWRVDGGRICWEEPLDLRGQVGMVLAEHSFVETGLTPYNRKRFFASGPVPVLEATLAEGAWRVHVSVQAAVEGHKYWGGFADVLDPEAVEEFLRCTHERYRARLGHLFGKVVGAIFTDETAPGWSERLPEAFAARFGYDLLAHLPALGEPDHPDHLRVAGDLERLRYELFVQTFEARLASWCREHGLRYAGEKPVLRLAQLRFSDLPGCDAGHAKAGRVPDVLQPNLRGNARAAASAAYWYGKEAALCECYHSLGWAATLQDLRVLADALLLMGVTHLVPHAFFYSTHGLRKHDAPPSLFWQMPYWPLFHHLSSRVERIAAALADTHLDARVLVVDPSPGLPSPADREAFGRLLELLVAHHVEFLIADIDVLATARMEAGPAGPRARVREVEATAVVVPPMRAVEPALEAWLRGAEAAGLAVLRVGPDFEARALAAELVRLAPPTLRLSAERGDAHRVWVAARRGPGRRLWLLLNTAAEPADVVLEGPGPLQELPLEPELPPRLEARGATARRRLGPFEAVLLAEGEGAAGSPPPVVVLRLPECVEVVPAQDNLLRLGEWELTVADGSGGEDGPRPVRPAPVANQLAEGGFRLRPAVRPRFGLGPEVGLPPLTLRYRTSFELQYGGPVTLVLEPGSVAGRWRLEINGSAVPGPEALRPVGAHVHGCLGTDLTPHLRSGRNTLVLVVESRRPDEGLLHAPYLAGAFGVALRPPRLVPRPLRGRLEAWEDNGLPHYAGVVEYRGEVELPAEVGELLERHPVVLAELVAPRAAEDAWEVSLNGGPWQAVPWSPRLLRLRPGEVRPGRNRLALRVYTTLARAFEGERFNPEAHRYEPV